MFLFVYNISFYHKIRAVGSQDYRLLETTTAIYTTGNVYVESRLSLLTANHQKRVVAVQVLSSLNNPTSPPNIIGTKTPRRPSDVYPLQPSACPSAPIFPPGEMHRGKQRISPANHTTGPNQRDQTAKTLGTLACDTLHTHRKKIYIEAGNVPRTRRWQC